MTDYAGGNDGVLAPWLTTLTAQPGWSGCYLGTRREPAVGLARSVRSEASQSVASWAIPWSHQSPDQFVSLPLVRHALEGPSLAKRLSFGWWLPQGAPPSNDSVRRPFGAARRPVTVRLTCLEPTVISRQPGVLGMGGLQVGQPAAGRLSDDAPRGS